MQLVNIKKERKKAISIVFSRQKNSNKLSACASAYENQNKRKKRHKRNKEHDIKIFLNATEYRT